MPLPQAILAALLKQPCSGYDLQKGFAGSIGVFWEASYQQIYRELSKLEEQGFLAAEAIQQQHRPDKKIYSVTDAGKEYLKAWILESCDIAPQRDDLLVKVFAGYLVSKETLLVELRHHRMQHQKRLAVYRNIEAQFLPHPESLPLEEKFRYLTLLNRIRFESEWLLWFEDVASILELEGVARCKGNNTTIDQVIRETSVQFEVLHSTS